MLEDHCSKSINRVLDYLTIHELMFYNYSLGSDPCRVTSIRYREASFTTVLLEF